AVAQGSDQEPRFIVLEYRGAGDGPPLALVGKGVTFDSGGISIKPAQNMEDMKFDMSGAAAVLGTFETLGLLKPKVNVVGLIPATENLPSGHAVKPGDVVKSHFGKTIEIINTDAEGRLILCDALSYVRRFKPAAVIDIATLTGAVGVALGQRAIGEMGNDEALLAEVRGSASVFSPSSFSSARGREPRPRAVPTRLAQGTTRRVRVGTALAGAAALLLVAAGAAAQVDSMARRDTLGRDSTTHRDTTARDTTARDTLPRYLPIFPEAIPAGPLPRGTRYTFSADSLILSNVQTLSDLLAHIP